MEVSALQAAPQANNHYARDDMDIDMDIDIDLGVEDYMERELVLLTLAPLVVHI